jgi:hypothetical protein
MIVTETCQHKGCKKQYTSEPCEAMMVGWCHVYGIGTVCPKHNPKSKPFEIGDKVEFMATWFSGTNKQSGVITGFYELDDVPYANIRVDSQIGAGISLSRLYHPPSITSLHTFP